MSCAGKAGGTSISDHAITQEDLERSLATGRVADVRTEPDCRLVEGEGIEFSGCVLDHASFQHGNFNGARFVDCVFDACTFRGGDFSDCRFERCRLYDAEANAASDFSYADLRRARFERCDLTTVAFTRIRGWGLEFVNCQASGADFKEADFALDKGNHASATFHQCNLAYADLTETNLTACNLSGSRLVHAICRNTRFNDADLSGCALDNIDARGATFAGIDLRGATFNNLDPRTTDLSNVRMDPEQGLLILRALGILVE